MSSIEVNHTQSINTKPCTLCVKGKLDSAFRQSLEIPVPDDQPFRLVDHPPDRLAIPDHDQMGNLRQYKWDDNSTLVVKFMHPYQPRHEEDEAYHKRIVKMVTATAPIWSTCTNIKFRFVDVDDPGLAQIRLTFWTDDEVPHDWEDRESYFGQWSYLGQESRGTGYPSMNLDFVDLLKEYDDAETSKERKDYLMKYMRATILHEFGHALGFIHEQLRGDRDKAFELDVEQIVKNNERDWGWSREKTLEAINDLYDMKYLKASKFDIKSIMIYSFDKSVVKQVKGKASEVQETFDLSDVDRQWASVVYPTKSKR